LRERPEDVRALALHFLERSRPAARFTSDALDLLLRQEWPGNVRELRNIVSKLGILAVHHEVTADEVRKHLGSDGKNANPAEIIQSATIPTLSEVERATILRALEATGGNQSLAAQHLGIPRRTFCRKLNEYKITFGRREGNCGNTALRLPTYFRAELSVPVVVTTKDGHSFSAEARNLSVGGLGLQNFRPSCDVAGELTLRFRLPDGGQPIDVKGVVVWSQPNAVAGIRFTEISSSTSDLVTNWVVNHGRSMAIAPGANPVLDREKTEERCATS